MTAQPAQPGDDSATFDVVAIGSPLVDILSHESDELLAELGMPKGGMSLIDQERAAEIYERTGPGVEVSGGSAANTMVGLASLGGTAAYIGRVSSDQLGAVFTHDLRAMGVHFDQAPASEGSATGCCLIMVTPDAERTMNTFLGAAAELGPADVDLATVTAAKVLYLEGYLFDTDAAKEAYRVAAAAAAQSGRAVALSLSDTFCVQRHRAEFRALVADHVDVLFANEDEICALYEVDDFDAALAATREDCRVAALTRGAKGSVVINGDEVVEVPAQPVDEVVDTTGAGDLYAAGFLYGWVRGESAQRCGELGALAAGEVISHMGARPERNLAELAAARFAG